LRREFIIADVKVALQNWPFGRIVGASVLWVILVVASFVG
jgi:hypothetical protein